MQGFRTYFHCAWITVVGVVLAAYDQISVFGIDLKSVIGDFVPVQYVGLIMIGIALLLGWMRSITRTPPFKSE